MFNTMLTPRIITIVFIIGALLIVLYGAVGIYQALSTVPRDMWGRPTGTTSFESALVRLLVMLAALIFWRVWCEIVILWFKIYDRLGEIRDRLPD